MGILEKEIGIKFSINNEFAGSYFRKLDITYGEFLEIRKEIMKKTDEILKEYE